MRKRWIALLGLAALASAADDFDSAARELGRRTAAVAGSAPVGVTWRNFSTLPPDAIAQARSAFEAAVRTTEGADAVMTVSENMSSGLLTEEFRGQVWIVPFRRPASVPAAAAAIEKRLLLEQDEPILDAVQTADGLLVLTPAALVNTRTGQRVRITLPKPWPRDPRGRLQVDGTTVRVDLPGARCSGTLADLACGPSDDTLAAGRNYFIRKGLPPFFTSATVDQFTVVTLLDGTAAIFDSAMSRAGSIAGLGSDVAPAGARCGGGPVIFATRPGEGRDAVQAYEITGRAARPIGDAAEFSGPVTALWPGLAVARNGKYQAYAIALVCGH